MAPRSFLSAYLLVGLLNALAVGMQNDAAATLTKPLLMPLLALWLVTEQRRMWPAPLRWLLLGLVFAWAGDLLLMGSSETAFALGIAAFLITQLSYVIAFSSFQGLRFRRSIAAPSKPATGLVRRHPALVIPFALYVIGLLAYLLPDMDQFRAPVTVYALAIAAMALAALNLVGRMPAGPAWVAFAGALLFVLSDSLIAVSEFGTLPSEPWIGAAIMLSYVIGQGLIGVGLVTGNRAVAEIRGSTAADRLAASSQQTTGTA